jgi:hypothetical protein
VEDDLENLIYYRIHYSYSSDPSDKVITESFELALEEDVDSELINMMLQSTWGTLLEYFNNEGGKIEFIEVETEIPSKKKTLQWKPSR